MVSERKKSKFDKFLEEILFRSWWLFLFLLLGYIGYYQAIKSKNLEIAELEYRLAQFNKKKNHMEEQKEDLLLRIRSQSDPAWIEMVLKRELGMVPEGQIKVHFAKRSDKEASD